MVVMLNKTIEELDGTQAKDEKGTIITIRIASMRALVSGFQDEQSLPGEEKLKRWELAMKIKSSSDPIELNAEEIALVKKLVAKAYGPLVVGQVWKFLEEGKQGTA